MLYAVYAFGCVCALNFMLISTFSFKFLRRIKNANKEMNYGDGDDLVKKEKKTTFTD